MRFCRLGVTVKSNTGAFIPGGIEGGFRGGCAIELRQQRIRFIIQGHRVLTGTVNPRDRGLSRIQHLAHFRYTLPLSIQ